MTPCVYLPWDSEFFARRIGRVTLARPTSADLDAADEWARAESIECLYLLADFADAETLRVASAHGFALMDLRLTYERQVAATPFPAGVRVASASDLPGLQAIARHTFVDTRFYRDPHFAPLADAFYERWIERALQGFADVVFVVTDAADAPLGFVCCHRRDAGVGEIGLTAVRRGERGAGLGGTLVAAAHAWFHAQGLTVAFVVTNGANTPAQRLYQRCGFRSREVQLWYHRWRSTPADE